MPKTDATKVKQKPGNKGDLHGVREEFLMSKMEAYMVTSKAKTTTTFWTGLFADYWKKFHWSLPLNQDPTDTDVYPDDNTLTAAQEDTKSKVQSTVKLVCTSPVAVLSRALMRIVA
ncbi:hypothetical protein K438DRAFT_1780838 [Mycena galopus ATCC 62051]|nr:hypothetical protein K438DRAFT_1780838 [Mycena galopus ATCC 62051]